MSEHTTNYPTFKSLPTTVKVYILFLLLIFLPVCFLILASKPSRELNWIEILIFIIVGIAFRAKPISITKKLESLELTTIVWFAAILLYKPQEVFLIVLVTNLIGDFLTRIRKWALYINTQEFPLIYYLASLGYNYLKANQPFHENLIANIPAIMIAGALIIFSNQFLHFLVYMFLYPEESFQSAVRDTVEGLMLFELSQFPVSIALAISYFYQPFSILLFTLPLVLFYVTSTYQSRIKQKEQEIAEERKRIEQDAHDRIYNKLGALAKKAELAANSGDARGEAKQTLDLLQKDLRTAVADLQQIVTAENKVNVEGSEHIIDQLENICSDFRNRSTIKLDFNSDNSLIDKIDPKNFWHLQCILEECLNNVHKHSNATRVNVSFRKDNGSLVLQIADNGKGIGIVGSQKLEDIVGRVLRTRQTENRTSGLGLRGMKERAEKMNAVLSINPNNGKGTKVELRLPI